MGYTPENWEDFKRLKKWEYETGRKNILEE